ncbi:related to transporter protein [Cephalotrichum gorgonifer]|uniref:Related to transporter protein n=1 Tax=Cephalotrichum gorgonifer TaxID=2041049 RepID=A0AAE8SRW9_9PEZI|nr:related to transporter protein [Cephalotrichum gorgonifer]
MTETKDIAPVIGSDSAFDLDQKTKDATIVSTSEVSSDREKSTSWARKIGSFFWDSIEGDAEYRQYVRRLDMFFFPTVCFGYFIKYLDQTNYSNAFVSGMQEDLSLYGNERNWLNTWFALGIMVGSVPAQMTQLSFIRPSILIPSCEVIWSCLVIGMGFSKNIRTMYALRFFIGLFEACAFPGYIAMLGSWYGPKELTKRLAILLQVESIASMFSGYLQAGLYTSMNGKHGLAGWRWLFIMDAVISFPIAFWGFFGLPDLPHNTRAFYWTEEHIQYGVERIEKFGQKAQPKLTWAEIKRVYLGSEIWAFVLPYTMVAACHSATSYFNLWLKATGHTVVQANVLPTAGNALNIVATVLTGMTVDRIGCHYWVIVVIQVLMMFSNVLLSVWHIPKGGLMFAFYLSYAGSAATPPLLSWAYKLNAGNSSVRQLLVATANVVSYAWVLWVPLVLFPTYDAPHYKYGYQILILFGGVSVITVTLMWYLYRRRE